MNQILAGIVLLCLGAISTGLGGYLLYEGLQARKLRRPDLITEKNNGTDSSNGTMSINVKPITNQSIKKINKILGGIILEGYRNNILAKYSLEIINKQYPDISTLQQSKVAPDFKECVFRIRPDESINLEFRGRVKRKRNDYTFSFIIYEDHNNIESISISYSISNNLEKSVGKFDFIAAQAFQNIPSLNIKTYRPSISHYFSDIPEAVTGILSIHNKSKEVANITIVLPVIEEGLFASSPIPCDGYRAGEFHYFELGKEIAGEIYQKGTISFLFKPYWHSNLLTPGIDPHFFYWFTDDGKNGIRIISDSKDNGKVKAVVANDGKISYLSSDITPINGEVYSIDFRYKGTSASMVVNGKNIATTEEMAFPKFSELPDKFYIGSNPKSEDLSAFSVIRDLRIYKDYLTEEAIRAGLFELVPEHFPEFKKAYLNKSKDHKE